MRRFARAVAFPVACLAVAASVAGFSQIPSATLRQADNALEAGEADRALSLLMPLPVQGPGAADAQNLLCRVWFSMQQWDPAVKACEQAVRLDPDNSNDHMWLGRALGLKADHVSFLTAYSLGKRVRSEFELAVQLGPQNADALSDLGQFYKEAPGVVGGGLDKAEAIATRLDKVDPVRALELRGRIASARKISSKRACLPAASFRIASMPASSGYCQKNTGRGCGLSFSIHVNAARTRMSHSRMATCGSDR